MFRVLWEAVANLWRRAPEGEVEVVEEKEPVLPPPVVMPFGQRVYFGPATQLEGHFEPRLAWKLRWYRPSRGAKKGGWRTCFIQGPLVSGTIGGAALQMQILADESAGVFWSRIVDRMRQVAGLRHQVPTDLELSEYIAVTKEPLPSMPRALKAYHLWRMYEGRPARSLYVLFGCVFRTAADVRSFARDWRVEEPNLPIDKISMWLEGVSVPRARRAAGTAQEVARLTAELRFSDPSLLAVRPLVRRAGPLESASSDGGTVLGGPETEEGRSMSDEESLDRLYRRQRYHEV